MKRILLPAIVASVGFCLVTNSFAASTLKSADKMSEAEQQSYAAGFAQGGQLNKMDTELGVKFNMDYFQAGFNDGYKNSTSALTPKQTESALMALQKSIMEKQKTYMEKQFAVNKQKGEEFLTNKAKEKGVKKLSDGVLYEVIKSGKSSGNPKLSDKVKVTYTGTTIDGREFDSNTDVELKLDNLIKGWQTALQKMSPGDKWKLYVPANQAYGEQGAPGIMPNSTLVFDIELKDIVKGS